MLLLVDNESEHYPPGDDVLTTKASGVIPGNDVLRGLYVEYQRLLEEGDVLLPAPFSLGVRAVWVAVLVRSRLRDVRPLLAEFRGETS